MKLKKCILLLPTTYNDGEAVPPSVISGILKFIDEKFDGHTVDGICDGTFRMEDGSMANDRLMKVWVAIEPGRVEELRTYAARIAVQLKQEKLYFEVTEAEVDLVQPPPGTEGLL